MLGALKLAEFLNANGRPEEAVRIARDLLPRLEEVRGPEHDHTRRTRALVGS